MQPDEYIETRVRQCQDWYDRKASSSTSREARMRGGAVVSFRARCGPMRSARGGRELQEGEDSAPRRHRSAMRRRPQPAPSHEAQIWDRVETQIQWYGRNARRSKRNYMRIKLVQIVAAAFIPVLAAASLPSWVLGGLGAGVVVLESVQQLFQFHSNWTQYRTTAEALKHEKFLALAQAGHYATAANPLALLAERTEGLVSQEHAAWSSEQQQAQSSAQKG